MQSVSRKEATSNGVRSEKIVLLSSASLTDNAIMRTQRKRRTTTTMRLHFSSAGSGFSTHMYC